MGTLSDLMLQCGRCKHKWLRRSVRPPAQCPSCKSKYWNKERVRKVPKKRKAARRG